MEQVEQLSSAFEHMTIKEPQKQQKKKRDYPIYWCIKILPEHLKDILAKIPDNDIAHLKKQETFHITMLFNRSPPPAEIIKQFSEIINNEVNIEINGYVFDSKGCALVVNKIFDHHELCTNTYPHISIGNTIDVKPVYNNTLLNKIFEKKDLDCTHVKFESPMHVIGIFTSIY